MQRRQERATEWERRRNYLLRSMFVDPPVLQTIAESEELTESDLPRPATDREAFSPLPDLIIERVPKRPRDDESEEYYDRLAKKMKKYYKKIFNIPHDSSSAEEFEDETYIYEPTGNADDEDVDDNRNEHDEFEYEENGRAEIELVHDDIPVDDDHGRASEPRSEPSFVFSAESIPVRRREFYTTRTSESPMDSEKSIILSCTQRTKADEYKSQKEKERPKVSIAEGEKRHEEIMPTGHYEITPTGHDEDADFELCGAKRGESFQHVVKDGEGMVADDSDQDNVTSRESSASAGGRESIVVDPRYSPSQSKSSKDSNKNSDEAMAEEEESEDNNNQEDMIDEETQPSANGQHSRDLEKYDRRKESDHNTAKDGTNETNDDDSNNLDKVVASKVDADVPDDESAERKQFAVRPDELAIKDGCGKKGIEHVRTSLDKVAKYTSGESSDSHDDIDVENNEDSEDKNGESEKVSENEESAGTEDEKTIEEAMEEESMETEDYQDADDRAINDEESIETPEAMMRQHTSPVKVSLEQVFDKLREASPILNPRLQEEIRISSADAAAIEIEAVNISSDLMPPLRTSTPETEPPVRDKSTPRPELPRDRSKISSQTSDHQIIRTETRKDPSKTSTTQTERPRRKRCHSDPTYAIARISTKRSNIRLMSVQTGEERGRDVGVQTQDKDRRDGATQTNGEDEWSEDENGFQYFVRHRRGKSFNFIFL